MIGVVVPAHDEEQHLERCLRALAAAAVHPDLAGEGVEICVVLDDCTDTSAAIAARHPFHRLEITSRNVGMARAAGAAWQLERGARWLAFTDADSVVASDWLSVQLGLGADLVCGTVVVDDWTPLPGAARLLYELGYRDHDDHRHVHGANLGVCSQAYRRVGGFLPLPAHEDVALVRALEAAGARVAWSAAPRVVTSARLRARAPEGFARHLQELVEAVTATALPAGS